MVCAVFDSQLTVHLTNNEVPPPKRDTLKEVMEGLRCHAGSRVFVCKFFMSFCLISDGGLLC